MPRRVLVVDDEMQIREILRAYLAAEGFLVQEAATGAQALHLLATEPADLVLLDIGLPDIDGLEVLRTLRKTSDVYVVLVTARAEEIDTILGLGVGADDYVTKPFSPREVVARVKAVLRRTRPNDQTGPASGSVAAGAGAAGRSTADPDVLLFDGVSVDIARREARVGGIPAVLTALEFDLLVALAGSPGRVFSRAQLLEKVWGYDFFGDERVVDVHIRGMRKALGDDAAAPLIIGTVRSVGYKFLLDPVEGPGPGGGAS
ncbi:MAG: response regulator transcription factor [Dermatophilaceae bacterium]